MSGLGDTGEELKSLHGGVNVLVYGMVGWLSAITVGAIVVFAVVYARLARASRELDDAETGSSVSSRRSTATAPAPASSRRSTAAGRRHAANTALSASSDDDDDLRTEVDMLPTDERLETVVRS